MRTTTILTVSCIVLSCLLVPAAAQAGYITNAPNYLGLERGLVGFWSFDGKHMAGNRASDLSGQGNHGTLTGSNGLPVRTIGKIGQALEFDGSDDYVEITDNTIFNLTVSQSYTWSFWLKPDDFEEWNNVWSQDVNNGGHGFFIYAHTSSNSDWGPVTAGISAGLTTTGGTNLSRGRGILLAEYVVAQ